MKQLWFIDVKFHVIFQLTEMIFDLKKVVENRQRNINRMFTPIIKVR
jgi:hypothetical protein